MVRRYAETKNHNGTGAGYFTSLHVSCVLWPGLILQQELQVFEGQSLRELLFPEDFFR